MKKTQCQTIVLLLLVAAIPCWPTPDTVGPAAARSGPASPSPDPPSSADDPSAGPPELTGEDAVRTTDLEERLTALRDQGNFAEAIPLAREIVEIRQRIQGNDYWETADARRRLATFEQAAALPEAQRVELGQAYEEFTSVEVLNGEHKYEEALELTRGQLSTFQRVLGDEHQATLQSMSTMGDLHYSLGQRAEAEQLFSQVHTSRRTTVGPNHPTTIQAMSNLGAALTSQGKLSEAEPHMREALAWFRRTQGDDHPQTLSSINNMGFLLEDLGRPSEAEAHYREALAGRRRVLGNDHSQTQNSVNNLGMLLMNQGHLAAAESLLRESLEGRRRSLGDDHRRTLTAINNLGLLLIKQGRLAEAEPPCRRALEARRRLLGDDHRWTLNSINNLGLLMMKQGRPAEAEPLYAEALEGSRRVLGEDHPNTIRTTTNLGGALNALGRPEEAEQLFRHALECRRRTLGDTHGDTLLSMNRLGLHLLGLKRFDESGPLLQQALEESRRVLGEQHPITLLSMQNLSLQLQRQKRFPRSEQLLRKALAGRRLLGETHPTVTRLLSRLAELQELQGNDKAALTSWTEAARSFESSRLQISFEGLERAHYAANTSPLPSLAVCLARAGEPAAAWRRLEENLARGLLDTLSARHSRPLNDDERSRETNLFGRLEQLDERISSLPATAEKADETLALTTELRRERDTLQSELARFEAELADRYGVAAGEVYPLSRIQATLPADAALLGWVDTAGPEGAGGGEGEHWACVVHQKGNPEWVRLPGTGPKKTWTAEDEAATGKLRDKLNRWGTGPADRWQTKELIQRVRTQRLAPLEIQLEGVKRLIVLPAGRMHGVPLEVLTDEYTVSYAPSGTMYAWLKDAGRPVAKKGRLPLLALGDPLFSQPDSSAPTRSGAFRALPHTRNEVEGIGRLFPSAPGQAKPLVLLGADASELRLQQLAGSGELAKFRFIHLATHGEMDDRRAMRSALILAQHQLPDSFEQVMSGQEIHDGRLTGDQIIRSWRLDAELITLSGCRTALGKELGGEGYLGFAQAFFVAGARSLLLSLWQVEDRATMLLMNRFYENLLGCFAETRHLPDREFAPGKPMPKAEALREAKMWLRELPAGDDAASRPFADPRYWAAFILLGE